MGKTGAAKAATATKALTATARDTVPKTTAPRKAAMTPISAPTRKAAAGSASPILP